MTEANSSSGSKNSRWIFNVICFLFVSIAFFIYCVGICFHQCSGVTSHVAICLLFLALVIFFSVRFYRQYQKSKKKPTDSELKT